MGLPILSASRLRDARACARLHHIKYDLGYRPAVEDEALRFGSLVHLGLEAWWDAAHAGTDRLAGALAAVAAGDADPFERVKAEAMLIGYHARWEAEPLRVIGVEVEFRTPLVNPVTGMASKTWQLGGKMDVLVERDGRAFLMEHKTSAEDLSPGSEYWKRQRMDPQIGLYHLGARSLGVDVEGVIFDVLKKPSLRPLKKSAEVKLKKDGTPYANQRTEDESPEEYRERLLDALADAPNEHYARAELVRLGSELDETLSDVWQVGKAIREGGRMGRWPRNADACHRYNRTCPFWPVCVGEASLDDRTRFRKSSNVHPELKAEVPT